uniref:Uncharacterized protein n=1 Tax=Ciona savignyi TaxID=51511 RepID=H2YFU1_CIOSA
MDFDSKLCENVVFYTIYLNVSLDSALLETYLFKCLAVVAKETKGYIWEKEPFTLHACTDTKIPCLKGSTKFSDSIQDEWFIVYLLHKITSVYPELIAQVNDNDGEFLLIESVDYLPKWLTPNTCANRVFISHGVMHVLLKPKSPAEISLLPVENPTLEQSLNIISHHPSLTQANSSIVACLQKRMSSFPASDIVFHANVYIGRSIVHLLDRNPAAISATLHAFFLRDRIDLKCCRQFKFFPPDDRVWTQIPMTRCHYAQLMQQHFVADKRSGYSMDINTPSNQHKGVELGIKLSHGFEITLAKLNKESSTNEPAMFDEKKFKEFLSHLQDSGYFQNEIEGSKLHKQLAKKARRFFIESCDSHQNDVKNQDICAGFVELLDTWGKSGFPELESLVLKDSMEELPQESSDKWMYLDNHDLDRLTKEMNVGFEQLHIKKKDKQRSDTSIEKLEQTVNEMTKFIDSTSSAEGVEIVSDITPITFDIDKFMSGVESMLGASVEKDEEDDSDDFLSTDEDESEVSDEETLHYMEQMDQELSSTDVGKSFVKTHVNEDDDGSTEDLSSAVNVDLNLVENFLQGCQSQAGLSGPVTNILGSLGVSIPTEVQLD